MKRECCLYVCYVCSCQAQLNTATLVTIQEIDYARDLIATIGTVIAEQILYRYDAAMIISCFSLAGVCITPLDA